jgi:hypothetical protein
MSEKRARQDGDLGRDWRMISESPKLVEIVGKGKKRYQMSLERAQIEVNEARKGPQKVLARS